MAFDTPSTGKSRGRFIACKFCKYYRPSINRSIGHHGVGGKERLGRVKGTI